VIDNATLLVGKCPKAENVCDGLVLIVGDEVRTRREGLILGRERYDDRDRLQDDWDRFHLYVWVICLDRCPCAGAADAVAGMFHVSLGRGCARNEIL
jgi:hypothetical protein